MAPKSTTRLTEAARKRSELNLTQEEAARLLNVSKNTWIRWEKGTSHPKELPLWLDFLWYLKRGGYPPPCREAKENKISGPFLVQHVAACKDCWLMVQFLAKTTKKPKS
jgi:transcriptional regulator with XRE-family HTH domain